MTEKRQDAQIFIIGHKPLDYGYWDNALYTPIQVGGNADFCSLRDNRGCNISDWNTFYAEGTATYWISRNLVPIPYIGQCQYRRRLQFPEDYDFDAAFRDCDVIAAEPLRLGLTVASHYCTCHNAYDFYELEQVVKDLYPEYAEDWEKYIVSGKTMYYSNSFVMRGQDYLDYADWLFRILFEFVNRKGWKTPQEATLAVAADMESGRAKKARGLAYQAQIGGFFSERLWTLYVQRNFERIRHDKYVKFEGV